MLFSPSKTTHNNNVSTITTTITNYISEYNNSENDNDDNRNEEFFRHVFFTPL